MSRGPSEGFGAVALKEPLLPHLDRRVRLPRRDPRCPPSSLPATTTDSPASPEPTADLAEALADPTVRGVAARFARQLNGAAEADDLLQTAALRVLRSGRQPSIALVHVALRHAWVDHCRRHARRPGDRPDRNGVEPDREGRGWQVVAAGSYTAGEDPLEAVVTGEEHDALRRGMNEANRTLRQHASRCGVSDREWQALRVVTDPGQPASGCAERKAASRARTKLRPAVDAWLDTVTASTALDPRPDASSRGALNAAQVDAVLRLAGILHSAN